MPLKRNLRALIVVCKVSAFLVTLLGLWWNNSLSNLAFNVQISLNAPDGSSATVATHSQRMSIFDVGSQAFPLTCAVCGVAKIGGLLMGATFDDSSVTNMMRLHIMPQLLLLSLLNQPYPTLLKSHRALPWVSNQRDSRKVWILHFYAWVCLDACRCAFVCAGLPFINELSSQGTAGDIGRLRGHWLTQQATMSLR